MSFSSQASLQLWTRMWTSCCIYNMWRQLCHRSTSILYHLQYVEMEGESRGILLCNLVWEWGCYTTYIRYWWPSAVICLLSALQSHVTTINKIWLIEGHVTTIEGHMITTVKSDWLLVMCLPIYHTSPQRCVQDLERTTSKKKNKAITKFISAQDTIHTHTHSVHLIFLLPLLLFSGSILCWGDGGVRSGMAVGWHRAYHQLDDVI